MAEWRAKGWRTPRPTSFAFSNRRSRKAPTRVGSSPSRTIPQGANPGWIFAVADSGFDGGADAGFDGGFDAGFDAGSDAGFDGGFDGGFDAGSDAGSDASAPSCSLVGDFSTVFSGSTTTFYFRFRADMTWVFALAPADLATSTVGGTYSVVGSTFTIRDSGTTSCMLDPGVYTMAWNPTCTMVGLTLVSDPCAGRSMSLAGSTFTRL